MDIEPSMPDQDETTQNSEWLLNVAARPSEGINKLPGNPTTIRFLSFLFNCEHSLKLSRQEEHVDNLECEQRSQVLWDMTGNRYNFDILLYFVRTKGQTPGLSFTLVVENGRKFNVQGKSNALWQLWLMSLGCSLYVAEHSRVHWDCKSGLNSLTFTFSSAKSNPSWIRSRKSLIETEDFDTVNAVAAGSLKIMEVVPECCLYWIRHEGLSISCLIFPYQQMDANPLLRMGNFRLTCENISGILEHEGALPFFLRYQTVSREHDIVHVSTVHADVVLSVERRSESGPDRLVQRVAAASARCVPDSQSLSYIWTRRPCSSNKLGTVQLCQLVQHFLLARQAAEKILSFLCSQVLLNLLGDHGPEFQTKARPWCGPRPADSMKKSCDRDMERV